MGGETNGTAWNAKEHQGLVLKKSGETRITTKGFFGLYSDCRVTYRSTFPCSPRSLRSKVASSISVDRLRLYL